jgi:hypothetical protein
LIFPPESVVIVGISIIGRCSMRGQSMFSLLIVVLCFVPFATTPAAPTCEGDVGFEEVLSRSLGSGITEPVDRIIRNEHQWCGFWGELHSRISPAPPCDTSLVDFSEEVAIVTALGPRGNTCYGVRVTCIDTAGGKTSALSVFVQDIVPGPDCACGWAIVYPVHVVKVDKPVSQLSFRHETAVLDCGTPSP